MRLPISSVQVFASEMKRGKLEKGEKGKTGKSILHVRWTGEKGKLEKGEKGEEYLACAMEKGKCKKGKNGKRIKRSFNQKHEDMMSTRRNGCNAYVNMLALRVKETMR